MNSFNFFNINTELLEKVEMNTSKCAVGIYKHERYFLSQMSASKHLSDNFVRNNWNKIISHDALLVEGYFLAENFNLAYNICKEFFDKREEKNVNDFVNNVLQDEGRIDLALEKWFYS